MYVPVYTWKRAYGYQYHDESTHVLKHHDKSGFYIFVIVDWEWKQEQGIIKSREDHNRLPADEEREPIHDRENQT